jgi:hypothetical protein
MLQLQRIHSDHPDFRTLVALLDQDLAIRDGDEHAFYAQFNKVDLIRHCVLGYLDHEPVACGAGVENSVCMEKIIRQWRNCP